MTKNILENIETEICDYIGSCFDDITFDNSQEWWDKTRKETKNFIVEEYPEASEQDIEDTLDKAFEDAKNYANENLL